MTDDRIDLRVSTAEREAVATMLGTAMAEGRLSMPEYEERLDQVWSSTTRGDLARVTADLPEPAPDADTVVAEKKSEQWREYLDEWKEWIGAAVLLNGIWGIICIASGELVYYWPLWPLGIWGLVLVASAFWDDDDEKAIEK